jgi:hypothetical protein
MDPLNGELIKDQNGHWAVQVIICNRNLNHIQEGLGKLLNEKFNFQDPASAQRYDEIKLLINDVFAAWESTVIANQKKMSKPIVRIENGKAVIVDASIKA